MRIELTRVGLLVYLANHYTTRGALPSDCNVRNSLSQVWEAFFQERDVWDMDLHQAGRITKISK